MQTEFKVGQRVQAHPATGVWMRGARYGTVTNIGRKWVHVKMDLLAKPIRFSPENLLDASYNDQYLNRL